MTDDPQVAETQQRLDDIADVVCRALAHSFPDGVERHLLAGAMVTLSVGFLREAGYSTDGARQTLIEFLQTAPLDDLRREDMHNHS